MVCTYIGTLTIALGPDPEMIINGLGSPQSPDLAH